MVAVGPAADNLNQELFWGATSGDDRTRGGLLVVPAHRPIQTTRNLPAFWAGNWRDVAKEMRGRYPKHPWPDDPASADPTLRTKNAARRTAGRT